MVVLPFSESAVGEHNAPASENPRSLSPRTVADSRPVALPAERIHRLLRAMSDADWTRLKALLRRNLTDPASDPDLDVLERLFRKGEALGGQAGGAVFRLVQAILGAPALLAEVSRAQERLRTRVRFVLREMADEDWEAFRAALEPALTQLTRSDDLGVLELVFRLGESVSNVEIAAQAKSAELSGRKPLHPEVARQNALVKAAVRGEPRVDPEAAYLAAKREYQQVQETARRAEQTLAFRHVSATNSYKHARHTVFQVIDSIVATPALLDRATRIEAELAAVPPVTREELRWAFHRLPVGQRLGLITLIPLNTILMFHANGGPETDADVVEARATRDRRLAYGFFVEGQNEHALAETHGLSVNAVKNTLGVILQTLLRRPLARKVARAYLASVRDIEPMGIEEVRRRMKRLTSEQRAALLTRIPNCVWKARASVIHLHKHLFLDYLSGEWVLRVLVQDHNLDPNKRLTGTFQSEGTLTVRGANAAITGVLHKISAEPEVRQRLREWTSPPAGKQPEGGGLGLGWEETALEELLPRRRGHAATSLLPLVKQGRNAGMPA